MGFILKSLLIIIYLSVTVQKHDRFILFRSVSQLFYNTEIYVAVNTLHVHTYICILKKSKWNSLPSLEKNLNKPLKHVLHIRVL